MTEREGWIEWCGHRTWYRVVGETEPGKDPLVALHGGPGSTHHYFAPLERLAEERRAVVLYDQVGCGRSARAEGAGWSLQLFLDELAELRTQLGLERIHLLGTSWGGMLALEYAFTRPDGLVALVLNSTPTSAPRWAEETRRLAAELPPGLNEKQADDEFWRRHVCRVDPQPEPLQRARAKFGKQVYNTMWGPNEFTVTGTLKDWDVTPRLGEIALPTLITSGRQDECTPALVGALHRGIAGSEWVLFEESAHMPHLEETQRYLDVVGGFLDRVESG